MHYESCIPRIVSHLRIDGQPTQREKDAASHLSPMMDLTVLRFSAVRLAEVPKGDPMEDNNIAPPPEGPATIDHARRVKCGFLNSEEVLRIATDPQTRLQLLLVRCGGGRFLAPAQDVAHFIELVEAGGKDYVRDVSLPAQGGTR